MQATTKQKSRSPRFEGPGERVPLSFRVTPGFKAKMDQIAAQSGRSLAQELEIRLERSLFDDEAYGGPQAAELFRSMGSRAKFLIKHPENWFSDFHTFSLVRSLWVQMLNEAAPPAPDPIEEMIALGRRGIRAICADQDPDIEAVLWEGGPVSLGEAYLSTMRALAKNERVKPEVREEFAAALAEAEARRERVRARREGGTKGGEKEDAK